MNTLKEFRNSVNEAILRYEAVWAERIEIVDELETVRDMSNDELNQIFSKVKGHKYETGMFYGGRHYFHGWMPVEITESHGTRVEGILLNYMRSNPLQSKLWISYMTALERDYHSIYNTSIRWDKITTSSEEMQQGDHEATGPVNKNFYKILVGMRDVVITKEDMAAAARIYKNKINSYEQTEKMAKSGTEDTSQKLGIGKLFVDAPDVIDDELIEQQITDAVKAMPENALTARTWGFEIEVPDAKGVDVDSNSGIDKGEDGSLRSYEGNSECECDCDDCSYHTCDCDNCTSYNDDPQHDCGSDECQTADMAEFRTTGGIQRLKHSGMYKLCKDLAEVNAEKNDTAGTHIHVYAADLTTAQVGQVMAIYKFTENIMSVVAGRFNVTYAKQVKVDHIASALRKKNGGLIPEKPLAVNVSHLLNDYRSRGTIEFRQMDCNLDADRITFWAWLVRGLVETAKRGATIGDFKKVTDLNGVIEALARWEYKLHDEKPGTVVPGSKADMSLITKVKHTTLR